MADEVIVKLKESQLPVLAGTSLADNDYVRIVTSAGNSRKVLLSDVAKHVANGTPIASVYQQKTYAVGDYCLYDGGLYRCTTAITTAEAWNSAHWTKINVMDELSEEVEELQTELESVDTELNSKADIDGSYADLHAGTSDQLLADTYTTDEEPYHFRQTPSHAGTREIEQIVGGSVVWNQLIRANKATYTVSGITITNNNDGSFTLNGTATERVAPTFDNSGTVFAINHVFLVTLNQDALPDDCKVSISGIVMQSASKGVWRNPQYTTALNLRLDSPSETVYDNLKITPQIIDLTAMLGTTIADHIYALEQANEGAGVAFFHKYFGDDYHPYDAGTMRSVEGLQSHVTIGKNLLDTSAFTSGLCGYREGETIDTVIASTRYCFSEPIRALNGLIISVISEDSNYLNAVIITCYDSQGKWAYIYNITNLSTTLIKSVQIPADTYAKVRIICGSLSTAYNIGTTVRGQVQVEFGSTATDYEPYEKHSYPLDSTVTLRGIPQLVDGKLKWNGDTYSADGVVTRNIVITDLANYVNNITAYPSHESEWAYINNFFPSNAIPKYILQENWGIATSVSCIANVATAGLKGIISTSTANSGRNLYIAYPDGITSLADFKTWLTTHPVTIAYAVATPATEQAEPYQSLQICSPYGTEEYVSTSIVPIGHYTKYPTDLKGIVEQIADAPSADGTYTLKATVSGGKVTYSWESA